MQTETTKTNGPTRLPSTVAPVVEMLPIDNVRENPLNRRSTWGDLGELAASIKRSGLLSPVRVRPTNAKNGKEIGLDMYELIFGARRLRACKLAGLTHIPAFVQPMTDEEALEVILVENALREGVHELDEAEAFEELRKLKKCTAEDLAAKLGRSKGYVYARLKLIALCPKVREAFRAGKVPASSALYIARLPTEKLQLEALEEVGERKTQWGVEEACSAREASKIIQERFMLRLVDAGFDITDGKLLSSAPACSACPKRTGAQPELFADVESTDLCTDGACFKEKRDAAWVQRSKKALEEGKSVLKGEAAKAVFSYNDSLAGGWANLDGECGHDPKRRKWREVLAKDLPVASIVRAPSGAILEVVTAQAATAAGKRLGLSWATPASRSAERGEREKAKPKDPKARAEAAKLERDEEIKTRATRLMVSAVIAAHAKRTSYPKGFWRLAVERADEMMGAETAEMVARRGIVLEKGLTHFRWFEKFVAKATETELESLFVEMMVSPSYDKRPLEQAVAMYGVDAKACAKKAKEQLDTEAAKAAEDEAKAQAAKEAARAKKPSMQAGSAKPAQKLVKMIRKPKK